jgi:hypothetical protein
MPRDAWVLDEEQPAADRAHPQRSLPVHQQRRHALHRVLLSTPELLEVERGATVREAGPRPAPQPTVPVECEAMGTFPGRAPIRHGPLVGQEDAAISPHQPTREGGRRRVPRPAIDTGRRHAAGPTRLDEPQPTVVVDRAPGLHARGKGLELEPVEVQGVHPPVVGDVGLTGAVHPRAGSGGNRQRSRRHHRPVHDPRDADTLHIEPQGARAVLHDPQEPVAGQLRQHRGVGDLEAAAVEPRDPAERAEPQVAVAGLLEPAHGALWQAFLDGPPPNGRIAPSEAAGQTEPAPQQHHPTPRRDPQSATRQDQDWRPTCSDGIGCG